MPSLTTPYTSSHRVKRRPSSCRCAIDVLLTTKIHALWPFSPSSASFEARATLPQPLASSYWSGRTAVSAIWASAVTEGGAVTEMFVIACHGCLWPHSTFPHAFSPIVRAQQVHEMLLERRWALKESATGDGPTVPIKAVFSRSSWVAYLHVNHLWPLQTLPMTLNLV